MGIKMYEALYQGNKVKLNEYKSHMHGKLICIHCGVPITYTKEHVRKIGNIDTQVKAYFRLKNVKDNSHKDTCDFITENQVKQIYAGCSNDKEIMTFQDNRYIVRLHIIVDDLPLSLPGNDKNVETVKYKRSTLQYIKSGDKPAYISTIQRIIKLRNLVEEEKDIRNELYLSFYDAKEKQYKQIKWKYFYIEDNNESYFNAYKYIQKKIFHPICFCGKVKSIEKPSDKFPWFKIKMYSKKIIDKQYVSLEILFKNESIFNEYQKIKGKDIIAYCGEHYVSKPVKSKLNDSEYFNIYTKIYGLNQIYIL